MKYADDMEYSGNPRTAVLVDFLIRNGVTRSIMYAKWMNPYDIHADAGYSVPPVTKKHYIKDNQKYQIQ